MEIETLITKLPLKWGRRSHHSSASAFDFPNLIESMKQSYAWKNGELISLILLNSPGKQIVLTALHENTEVGSFNSCDAVTIEIIQGKMKFNTHKESVILDIGQSLTLHEKVTYSLTTLVVTVFLLTIVTNTFQRLEN